MNVPLPRQFIGLVFCVFLIVSEAAGVENDSFEPHTFTLPDGYELELAAAPPLVKRPIHMYYDVDGSLYVTDSSGNTDKGPVQLENPSHRILRLVDKDEDGVFDQSTVYAENVPFPEGILVYNGSVYVGAPPHIWKFTDTDGDYVSDERAPWFDGASIGPCANDLHGPYLAPDGYFYWTKGGFQEQSFALGNGDRHQSRAAHIFRAKPDGSGLEVVITGGMNNPVGLAFSESGERFLSGTFFDLSRPGRRDGILHAVYGGMYGRRNEVVLSEHPHTGDLLPILTQLGPSASSGILMPRNNALGLKDDLLCADFNLRRISWHTLSRTGSSYALETGTFLESDQMDFHPTDVIEDADGSLLVADTGSWYLVCCPTSQVAKPHVLGAIYRVRKTDASVPKDPRGLKLDWESPDVSYLSDERPFVVNRAIDVLAKEEHIDDLQNADARVPAIWVLNRIESADARKAVREFINDDDSDARVAAIHSAALWRDMDAVGTLIDTLSDEDPLLRRLAAMALGRIGDRSAVNALLREGTKEQDPFLKHAITYALFELGESENVPENHPLRTQLRVMEATAQRDPTPNSRPDIKLAKAADRDPETVARQFARLNELMPILKNGDAKRGEKLFADASKTLCITCHVKGDQGVDFGPDLTKIGAIRSSRDLLEAILFPSVSIARYYELVHVRRERGESSGLLRKEAVDALILSPAPGEEQAIPLGDIIEAEYSNVSLMPEVFDSILSPQEIADLIAYLKTDTSPGGSASVGRPSLSAGSAGSPQASSGQANEKRERIPAHQPTNLSGLHAYAQKSIAAGDEIEFRVSSTVPYELPLVQLGSDPENRDGDPILERIQVEYPRAQPIHPGSYVHVANGLPADEPLTEFTLEGWIRPFRLQGWQGLITQHEFPDSSGIGVFLNEGRIAFITMSGMRHDPNAIHQTEPGLINVQTWHHVVASWDGQTKRIYVDGKLAGEFPFSGQVYPGRTALRLGAYGKQRKASDFYDGDLAQCVIYSEALSEKRIQERFMDQGRTSPSVKSVLACWPFSEERGIRVADTSSHRRHGQIINRGTWMIGGPSFDASAIDRHDSSYDPTTDSNRGHGLRLASDELYNARWDVSHRFKIPIDAKSGVYAGRFDFEIDGKPKRYFTSFIVRRPESRPKAPLLVLVSSNTWLAYNSAPFPENHGPGLLNMGTKGLATSHPDAATYSGYRDHRAGQPTYKIGLKLPWPAAGPNKIYQYGTYSHLLRGERFLHLWLDRHGYEYDVITDHDLDRNPEILKGYQAVLINGHSEYWSIPAYEGLDNYLKAGGAAVVMSGNTMFWRVSFDETGEVMECRKFGTGIGGRTHAQVGELYHSHDFKRGSLMRFCGYPAWKMVGLTCIGWGGAFQPYRVDQPDHFLFNQPRKLGLKQGDTFGYISEDMGAVGHEFDVRLPTLQRATADPAIKGLVEPEGIVTVASSHHDRKVLDFNAEGHQPRYGDDQTIAEIIYWERPQGGRVFHTGSIATAWGLYHDDHLSKLVRNVLHHFGVKGKDE